MKPHAENRTASVWTEADAIFVVFITLLMTSGGILGNILGTLADTNQSLKLGFLNIIALCMPVTVALMFLFKKHIETGFTLRGLLGITSPLSEVAKGFVFGIFIAVSALPLTYLVGVMYTKYFTHTPEAQTIMLSIFNKSTPLWISITASAIIVTIAPFAEEVMYRGILVSVLGHCHSKVFSVVSSALFFSLLHMHLPAAPTLFFVGVVFAVAHISSGSILLVTAMHAAFNLFNLAISLLL
jgi:membrane protease YdiL (CAAX protease family)